MQFCLQINWGKWTSLWYLFSLSINMVFVNDFLQDFMFLHTCIACISFKYLFIGFFWFLLLVWIISLLNYLYCLFLVYKNTIAFTICILYPATLTNSLIISINFYVIDSLGISIQTLIYVNNDDFTSSFLIFILSSLWKETMIVDIVILLLLKILLTFYH